MTENKFIERYANRLKSALEYCFTSQKELSKMTGIPESTISTYCRGARMPTVKNIINIANALDYEIDYFIDADEPIK